MRITSIALSSWLAAMLLLAAAHSGAATHTHAQPESPPPAIEAPQDSGWGDGSDDVSSDGSISSSRTCSVRPPEQARILKQPPRENPCRARGTSVVVFTWFHSLYLCQNNQVVGDFDIALGRGGIYKRREGDRKTPIGTYPLLEPYPSREFGTFIPVGYPTVAERRAGYTGSDIGIHGPARRFRCAGFMNTSFDWTRGCVAVASDEQIETIAAFVRANPPLKIHILDDEPEQAPGEPEPFPPEDRRPQPTGDTSVQTRALGQRLSKTISTYHHISLGRRPHFQKDDL
ncbi:MAG: L,D-transpeptidase family protein [Bdellovibrionaceae bacterium]|nr:L,D-transpeptidase family protein [Pseudobdellovibrionaceae bacterium]